MKLLRGRQAGVTVIELAAGVLVASLIWVSVLQAQAAFDHIMARTLVTEMQALQQMVLTYQDRYGAIPGDDKGAAGRFAGAISATSPAGGNGAIDGPDWAGETDGDALATDEPSLFWQHVRLAGLAAGDPASFDAYNALRGLLGISSSNAGMPTRPPGARNGLHVCSGRIDGHIARLMDIDVDDGDATTGKLWAADELENAVVLEERAPSQYDDGKTYTVCMLL